MADGKFSEIASHFVVDGLVVVSHIKLGEEGARGTKGADGSNEITAEEWISGDFDLEG